ncbi:MAG: hypothetical protein Q9169_001780 [Polycauliona sp. 2 TL-2023]
MGLLSPYFLFGSAVLLYLGSFVVFAILRIATGISIQRIGYCSLRHVAFTLRDGVRLEIRGLGLVPHRPTFAQPRWISLCLEELKIIIDPKNLSPRKLAPAKSKSESNGSLDCKNSLPNSPRPALRLPDRNSSRSRTWKTLTQLKERLKKLHEKINWLCLVDLDAWNLSCVILEVGKVEVGNFHLAVDTRRQTVDRGRLFQHKRLPKAGQRPAEWLLTVKSVLFTPEGKDSLEVLDICNVNVHGLLYEQLPGLRDASISIKLGRIHVPIDDLMDCQQRVEYLRRPQIVPDPTSPEVEVSFADVIEELDRPGSREAKIVQTVSDSKEFVSSILRGIQEIQLAISFVGMSKKIDICSNASPIYLHVSMNEIGVDLHRLDPKSPAHRMYFSSRDVAHQALLAAISIAFALDDGDGKPERVLYLPMATTTIKTTLPSKTVTFSEDKDAADRNTNILFANLVLTSPSIDVDPKHLSILFSLIQNRQSSQQVVPRSSEGQHHHLISRLLPKASVKISVHEPVIRVALPPADPTLKDSDDFDILICCVSSIALDTDSSHSSAGDLHYLLLSSLRIASHQLYYQTAAGERHNLSVAETLELKVQVTASPEVAVTANGNLQTLSLHMVRPEISDGVRQIIQQIHQRSSGRPQKPNPTGIQPSFLRRIPYWLLHCQLQGSNFGIEVAGVDSDIAKDTRGIALQLESWTAEYKAQKDAPDERPPSRRRRLSKTGAGGDSSMKVSSPPLSPPAKSTSTDGRRLAIHVRGFEGFVVEGLETLESDPFIGLPRFEVALSTSNDGRGPIFHLNSHIKSLYLHYSLYRYYAIGVAVSVLKRAFDHAYHRKFDHAATPHLSPNSASVAQNHGTPELLTVDLKAGFVQIKSTMPSDPPMMLHMCATEAGRHRWSTPFMKSRLVRVYAGASKIQSAWARLISVKSLRVDLRELKRKHGRTFIDEKSIDIGTDFIRLAVPHQLVIHKIVDNIANVTKATEQLHHRFNTDSTEYIMKKRPAPAKKVPKIFVRSKALLFELEDGPFEWKLGSIYRLGLIEQKLRLAREEAFLAKKKHMNQARQRQTSTRQRTQSARHVRRDRSSHSQRDENRARSGSPQTRSRGRSRSDSTTRGRKVRYDPDGQCGLTAAASISTDEAWERLQHYNAQSWKKRIDGAYHIQNSGMREIRNIFWGHDEGLDVDVGTEKILGMPERPGLLSALISDLYIVIDKPSFPIQDYPSFLHRVGKGMPRDMEYTLVIPMSVQIDMGEARFTLRDYPLPLLHVPAIRPGQSPRLPSWSLKTDFVIAEEYRGDLSVKQVPVQIVPPDKCSEARWEKGFAVDVRRTVSPVKTYSDVQVAINTSAPTSITWGTSYQPAIQDMMMIIEGFTKPQVDPSERVGFWDKIRLSFHSRISVAWKGDGDVHLKLKGARDPYMVTGHGAGFVMCWCNGVRWDIHRDDDPKKFMSVTSGEYVLAIPDYSHQARENGVRLSTDQDSISSSSTYRNGAMFKKVIMKLSGNVRWLAGLVFERDVAGGARSFDFMPHYNVALTTPDRATSSHAKYDAYHGFRSNHIHMSLAVAAPLDRDWALTNVKPSTSYNTVHLSPRFFTHFLNWWSMFSGVMSLPIRQGKLFPGVEKTSKKFGRHLATFKYKLLLSPLFLAHVYKHKDAEDHSEDLVSATGLKMRIDSFMLDLHQRREEFAAQGQGRSKQLKTTGMRINQAQLDFIAADLRAVSASIAGTTADDVRKANDEELAAYQEQATASVDMSRFTIPDNDFTWIDMDDLVELDWILPAETTPEMKIMPLAYSPRFTYFRQTDHSGSVSGDTTRSSSFGKEDTHFCVMSQDNDPRRVQCELIKARIAKIDEQLETHQRTLGEQELRVVRDGSRDGSLKERFETLKYQGRALNSKKQFLQTMFSRLTQRIAQNRPWTASDGDTTEEDMMTSSMSDDPQEPGSEKIEAQPLASYVDDFNNRFIVHNVQLKWNNALRNIILRYVHQVSQRRGFIYYMSRTAVKFILDIVEEQHKNKQRWREHSDVPTPSSEVPPPPSFEEDRDQDPEVEDRIQELLNDGQKFVNADDAEPSKGVSRSGTGNLDKDISEEYTPLNSYHVRLIAPQIQLQSEKNPKSVLLVTAKGMQLKVVQIMDKDRMMDEVSGLVQRRFSVDMDSVQFFVTAQKIMNQFLHLYSGSRYGTPKGSAWPPWVPFEVNFDFEFDPFGFSRVVQRTSASLRYDKYNTLRLKYNDEVNTARQDGHSSREQAESRIDHIWVEFPHIRAICDSVQYYTMYVIVLDLLLYSEPLEKVRSERLEKIMLASDFSDLRGAPEMVISLQDRIRQLEEIKNHFQIHAKYLDRQGWQDRLAIEHDLTSCEDELFFMMKAITTSQRKNDDRSQATQTNGLLRWYLSASEIVWHLMRVKNEPLMEIQLQHALYDRTDNSDGSNHNSMEIERMRGLNLLPNALYPEMLAPYSQNGKRFEEGQDLKMLSVQWHMLEAIAGIPVLDQFEVNLFPLKVQLEREIGKKLFEYIFPGVEMSHGESGNFSPFLAKQSPTQDEDGDSDQNSMSDTATYYTDTTTSNEESRASPRPGSLELRLRPTKALGDSRGAAGFNQSGKPTNGILKKDAGSHHFSLFQHANHSQQSARLAPPSKKTSRESLRPSHDTSSTSLATMNGSSEKYKRFGGLKRSNTGASENPSAEKDKASDDLTQMLSRASNYMTLAYVKIPSVVLCLSYKGRGERNIEDVHNFVFRMPVLEYRNKTWSNLDLALRLKKDVIKALISHTGAIIGNKFSHHRPSKYQQSRLRELADIPSNPNTSSMISVSQSEASSMRNGNHRAHSPGRSDASPDHNLKRLESGSSSLGSSAIASNNTFNHFDPPSIPEIGPEGPESPPRSVRSAFTRRFTGEFRSKDPSPAAAATTNGEDTEENTRKKSMMLFGKKILGSLN